MSPTIDDLAKLIGRPLKEGDVIIRRYDRTKYEVTGFTQELSGRIIKKQKTYINYRALTDIGPRNQVYSDEVNRDVYVDVVREEDRTDKPSLRER